MIFQTEKSEKIKNERKIKARVEKIKNAIF
jgi:hypothetical protein